MLLVLVKWRRENSRRMGGQRKFGRFFRVFICLISESLHSQGKEFLKREMLNVQKEA